MIRKHFRLKRIVLGLAFAAIAAPAAQATPYGGAPESQQDQSVLSTEVSAYEVVSDRAILPPGMTLASSSIVRSENSFGAPGPSAAGATGPSAVPHVITAPTSGFDWSDAGIGASAALAAALMLLTAVGLGRRYRTRLDRTLASA